MEQIFNFIR